MWQRSVTVLVLAGLASTVPLAAQPATPEADPVELVDGDRAIVALNAELQIEEAMLEEDLRRYEVLSTRRGRALSRLAELYRLLDEALNAEAIEERTRSALLLDQVESAEADRRGLLVAERALIEKVLERDRRIALLREQLGKLAGQQEEEAGPLSGNWDVVLMPLEQRGEFSLRQSGTLVSGTYELSGGWTGSLQGTLVNRKVYLIRIDSKLGRAMEFEGFLSGDGTAIRGTWLNYELAGAEGGTGQWSATKR